MQEIYNKLKTDFFYATGLEYRGLIASIGAGFASRISEFTSKLDFIKKQSSISTADKDYLSLLAGGLVPPKASEKATGNVIFYGEAGTTIPIGTELKTDDAEYVTTTAGTIDHISKAGTVSIANGKASFNYPSHQLTNCKGSVDGVEKHIVIIDQDNVEFEAGRLVDGQQILLDIDRSTGITVEAKEAGSNGNVKFNNVLKTKTTLAGIDISVGVLEITGGKDIEDTEEYRKRVLDFLRNPQSPFNSRNIEAVCKNAIKTLRFVWVERPRAGEVVVVGLNHNGTLTADEISRMTATTKSIAPAQMDQQSISAQAPSIVDIQVVISNLVPNSDGLRTEIEKNIKTLYDVDTYEKGISDQEISSTIFKTANGSEKVESFNLVSGGTTATDDTFFKYTGTTFQ